MFYLRSSSFFFKRLSSIFFGGRLSSSVHIRLHIENQLPELPGSALKVSVGGGLTHYFVNPNLELRLSWAVTKVIQDLFPIGQISLLN